MIAGSTATGLVAGGYPRPEPDLIGSNVYLSLFVKY